MIGRWHDKKPSKALGIKADNVSVVSVGKEKEPAPKLVGPVNPLQVSTSPLPPVEPVTINPPLAKILAVKLVLEPKKVSPVKLMAPLPFATTLDPICAALRCKLERAGRRRATL